jgi:hypothetical protein
MNNISFCGDRRAVGRSAIKFDLPERIYYTFLLENARQLLRFFEQTEFYFTGKGNG